MISEVLGGGLSGINSHKNCDNELLFDRLCSAENIFLAWYKFRRGKRARLDVMHYGRYLEHSLFDLQEELRTGAYRHGLYQAFTTYDPKERRIHKAIVKDRVVHQAIVNVVEPVFERQFIFDSFSCRRNKGTHAAVCRLRKFLLRASCNSTRTIYILKCDIKKFFDSVDHNILMSFLQRRIADPSVIDLLKVIINSFAHISGKGIPLGNLTNQLFANVYLHELDRFVKHELREQWYLRYCDDFVIVSKSRKHLLSLVPEIDRFLINHLKINIHPNKVVLKGWAQGVDYLGYVFMPYCTVLRSKTKKRILKRVDNSNIASYLGLCSHASSHCVQQIIKTKAGVQV